MALLSALARRLGRSRLAQLSRVSSLPFQDADAVPLLARRGASRGIESSIDPRAILGGGALGVAPTGALTAAALREYEPWEDQFQHENATFREAEAKQEELRRLLEAIRRGEYVAPPG